MLGKIDQRNKMVWIKVSNDVGASVGVSTKLMHFTFTKTFGVAPEKLLLASLGQSFYDECLSGLKHNVCEKAEITFEHLDNWLIDYFDQRSEYNFIENRQYEINTTGYFG